MIGLLGGIAAGKTTVARMLAELGARTVNADEIGHAVLAQPAVREQVVALWGRGVLGPDGGVDRAKVARRAFRGPKELAALEAITHPAIRAELHRQIAAARAAGAPAIVVDAPLLVETELDAVCDALVFVDCPREVRRKRAAERGWKAAELARRERLQAPLEIKRARARFVINGNGPLETTTRQVQELWQEIRER
ncbi:MAG TPA: dephospho-CoA kinase [Planctomycetota bacterium]|nr:dephospho-CoA kinase [Planctomycetota bacterium]HRR80037.1 dephospho-CoA kinase [Planctomycetota bacterium]HRT93073.1 dephospho-CoA kinase [Planctomycetota bacterium]